MKGIHREVLTSLTNPIHHILLISEWWAILREMFNRLILIEEMSVEDGAWYLSAGHLMMKKFLY